VSYLCEDTDGDNLTTGSLEVEEEEEEREEMGA
jgi:hypothetical protein